MKLYFHGCDYYEQGDSYRFTDKFDQWWQKELRKRIATSKEFAKKHGKNWGLSITFRALKGTRKPGLLGPGEDLSPKCTGWYILLPSFRYKSPDIKAYVPLLRQLLVELAGLLEREQIDATKLRKDSKLLLKRFVSQRGMLEYDDLEEYIAEEEKKDRDRGRDSGRLLKADRSIREDLKNLRRKYKFKSAVAFDATGKEGRGKGWLADYVIVDLTVALPSKRALPMDSASTHIAATASLLSHRKGRLPSTSITGTARKLNSPFYRTDAAKTLSVCPEFIWAM